MPYQDSVFINCPFDRNYWPTFEAVVFTVLDCGFTPRCALEVIDSSVVRIDKIGEIIAGCRLGVHDISRAELDEISKLPRFNMPLELGIFLGAKRFGDQTQRRKKCFILDREPYLYQVFCSDISGQDISFHRNEPDRAIVAVRDWLQSDLTGVRNRSSKTRARRFQLTPGGPRMVRRFQRFKAVLPGACALFGLDQDGISFSDFVSLTEAWLETHDWTIIP